LAAVAVEALRSPGHRDMARRGPYHRQRSRGSTDAGTRTVLVEFRFDQVARLEVRGVGVRNVLGERPLALLVPLHLGAQRRQDRKVVDGHLGAAPVNFWHTPPARQNLPGLWLTAG